MRLIKKMLILFLIIFTFFNVSAYAKSFEIFYASDVDDVNIYIKCVDISKEQKSTMTRSITNICMTTTSRLKKIIVKQ